MQLEAALLKLKANIHLFIIQTLADNVLTKVEELKRRQGMPTKYKIEYLVRWVIMTFITITFFPLLHVRAKSHQYFYPLLLLLLINILNC